MADEEFETHPVVLARICKTLDIAADEAFAARLRTPTNYPMPPCNSEEKFPILVMSRADIAEDLNEWLERNGIGFRFNPDDGFLTTNLCAEYAAALGDWEEEVTHDIKKRVLERMCIVGPRTSGLLVTAIQRPICRQTGKLMTQEEFDAHFEDKFPAQPSIQDYEREQIVHIQRAFWMSASITVSDTRAKVFWDSYSNSVDASWVGSNALGVIKQVQAFLKDPELWWRENPYLREW